MNYDPESEENHLDQTLRDKFGDYQLTPGTPVWQGIAGRLGQLPPPALRRRRWLPVPLLLMLTAFVSGLAGWLLPHKAAVESGENRAVATVAPQNTAANGFRQLPTASVQPNASAAQDQVTTLAQGAAMPQNNAQSVANTRTLLQHAKATVQHPLAAVKNASAQVKNPLPLAKTGGAIVKTTHAMGATTALAATISSPQPIQPVQPVQPGTTVATADLVAASATAAAAALPAAVRPLVALEVSYQVQPKPSLADPAVASRAAVVAILRAERVEILRLQRRTDSLLLALGEVLPAAPLAALPDTAATAEAKPKPAFTPMRRWSLLFTAAPEQNYLKLDAAPGNELTALRRNQETGRIGFNASLQAEYQVSKRFSIGAGLGYSKTGAELRQAVRNTENQVVGYDTAFAHSITDYQSIIHTYSVRIVQVAQLSPVFNASGQVLRYDTVYVPRNDTLRSTIVSHDTVHSNTKTLTPRLQPVTTTTYKTYRPDYRFFTIPIAVRYRLSAAPDSRWWADVSAGAQLQFFLGGTQLVTNDGLNFHTESVSAGEGPFRPFNLALNGALSLNYALNKRLSLNAGPSLRWQTLSVYRPETGLRQQPTAAGFQVGLRWKL